MSFLRRDAGNGVPFGEVYSVLQKSIRRGLEREGLIAAAMIGQYPNALNKRLVQNTVEDVGNLHLALQIFRSPFPKLMQWAYVVLHFPKSHSSAWLSRLGLERAIATPAHQLRQIRLSLDLIRRDPILACARCILAKKMDELEEHVWDPLASIVKSTRLDTTAIELKRMYNYINHDPMTWSCILLWCKYEEIRNTPIPKELPNVQVPTERFTRDTVPEFALDKHTARGKARGMGIAQFMEEGLRMNNPLFPSGDPFKREVDNLFASRLINPSSSGSRRSKDLYNEWDPASEERVYLSGEAVNLPKSGSDSSFSTAQSLRKNWAFPSFQIPQMALFQKMLNP